MCRSNAARPWGYRAVSPIGGPAAPDQLSSGRKRFRHRPAHFPESERLLWLRRRLGMHLPIAVAQLLHRTQHRKNQSMFRTIARAFAVDSLRAGDHDFLNRQVFLADDLEYLGRAERIYMHKFRNLWHVTAVGGLVKNDVCLV